VVRSRVIFGLDALAIACAVAAAALALTGDYRDVLLGQVISAGWPHATFAALAVMAIRHAAAPTPSILSRRRGARLWIAARPAVRDAALAFVLTRPTVLLVGLLAVSAIGVTPSSSESIGRDPLATLPARFDSGWYAGIAADGYEWQHRFDRQQNLAFFPAYPVLMRVVGMPLGATSDRVSRDWQIVRFMWAGLIIALAAFFWATWYLSRIAREVMTDERATAAVLLLAAYPFAMFYSAAYTEALFLLAAVGAWHHFRHEQWARAALWGLVAGLTRPNGCFLSLPLGLLALGRGTATQTDERRVWVAVPLAVAAAPGIGMLAFTLYTYQLTGIWFAWARMHGAWGRTLGGDATSLLSTGSAGGLLQYAAAHPFQALNALGVAFALALVWPVWRTHGAAWALFVVANVIPPLVTGGVLSMGRLTATLFPIFLALAAILPPRAAAGCAALFGILQGFAAVLFFTWRELF
jgi:hypothetical protein